MTEPDRRLRAPRFGEFVVLMAILTSLTALSIDTVLPALPEIGRDLGVQRENDNQLVISLLILGMAMGQMIYGPLSDSTGRKPAMYAGIGLFIVGCLLSLSATHFPVLLAGRFLQGMGAAGPRVVTVALVRDQYAGRAMARVMSFIMAVFIIIPAIAPFLGQGILLVAHWRVIFGMFLALALTAVIWFAVRQPETLAMERRIPFSLKKILSALREICTTPVAFGYTIASGLIFGAFVGYLSSAQQIFQAQYGLGTRFPLYFAVVALAIGSASIVNTRFVMRYGMRVLTSRSSLGLSLLSAVFFTVAFLWEGHPPLWMLMTYLLPAFFCVGILFGNMNASAMEPLGHIAGVGAAAVGSVSAFISVSLGTLIGQAYNDTILPLVGGFALLGSAAMAVMHWTEARRRKQEEARLHRNAETA
jgi:DHA1 family bicyclomycin/chloramphenicol resistance-like MFS transporter